MADGNYVVRLPEGSWDSHIHVIDKVTFPLRDDTPFTPKQALLPSALAHAHSLGLQHVCIIAASPFGLDNRCLIDALRRLEGHGRGVAYIDPDAVTEAELDELHAVGVRGVRLNLWTYGRSLDPDGWPDLLEAHARVLRPRGWVLQLFVSMDQIVHIAPQVAGLGVKVVFDHLGCPNPGVVPAEQPGCRELYDLLTSSRDVYVKISGAYRFEDVPELDAHMQKLVDIAPDQVVWASDWPHTGGVQGNPDGDPNTEQEFLTPDIPAFLLKCVEMCKGNNSLIRKMWLDNPRRLWDYNGEDQEELVSKYVFYSDTI